MHSSHITHLQFLLILLLGLILLSAFFSAAEIGMMSLNRYRLRSLIRKKNRSAIRVHELLQRPDRLLGIILIGNNFANILASAVATVIAVRLYGDLGVLISTIVLTLVILIFAEITPKTLAALYPEQVAFPSSWLLQFLLFLLYPIVWIINVISNGLLRLFRIKVKRNADVISHDELRVIVKEAMGKNLPVYQGMLLSILDLQKVMVEDIMVPRNAIVGIDLTEDWSKVLQRLLQSEHMQLPVYYENIDDVKGMLHLKSALNLMVQNRLNKDTLLAAAEEIYFVPEGTSLDLQLIHFCKKDSRNALVVDEYGDILGLITIEDILEEIIGEFTTHLPATRKNIRREKSGSYLVNGSITVRDLNRIMHWQLPIGGAKTLSGKIIEYLEALPEGLVCLRLGDYRMEIVEMEENKIKTVRIFVG